MPGSKQHVILTNRSVHLRAATPSLPPPPLITPHRFQELQFSVLTSKPYVFLKINKTFVRSPLAWLVMLCLGHPRTGLFLLAAGEQLISLHMCVTRKCWQTILFGSNYFGNRKSDFVMTISHVISQQSHLAEVAFLMLCKCYSGDST